MIRRRDFLAAWWLSTLPRAATVGGSGLLAGCAHLLEEDDDPGSPAGALAAQQEGGWNVGSKGQALAFPYAVDTDVDGGSSWRDAFGTLPLQLGPRGTYWLPYYDPTLFQVLAAAGSADLQLMMRPIFSPAMNVAFARGQSLLSLFTADGGCRSDIALIVDLPGPEAVALAAALAPCFDPVFVFDNWPHPAGVVPSHLTLAAALYYSPVFQRAHGQWGSGAAPVFVLDRNRMRFYSDASDAFDNRYFVSVPPRRVLGTAGIRHVLYVTPDDELMYESDDLNDDLVDFDRGGIDVKVLAMTDFSETRLPDWVDASAPVPAPQADPDGGVADAGAAADAAEASTAYAHASVRWHLRYYFGGSRLSHDCFWSWYGWPRSPGAMMGRVVPQIPRTLVPRTTFRATPRSVFAPRFRGGVSRGSRGGSRGWWGRGGSRGRTHWGGFSG